MKLTLKLMSILVAGIVGLTALDVFLTVRREVHLFESDMRRDALVLGRSTRYLLDEVWRISGEEQALALIERLNAEGSIVRIRWVWLDEQVSERYRPRIPTDTLAPVRNGKELAVSWPDAGDAGQLYVYIPVSTNGGRKGALELAESLAELHHYTGSTIMRAVVLAGGIVLLGGIGAVCLGVLFVGRPLGLLSEKARRVGQGDFSGPLALPGRDELSELAASINTMCDQLVESRQRVAAETEARLSALDQLRHADRLKTVGRLASGIAHELGTPLNVVAGRASMIAGRGLSSEDVVENARIIKAQADRMATIIRQLLDFTRSRPAQREQADIRNLAGQTLSLLTALARKRNVNLTLSPGEANVWATIDSGQIQQVLTNLIINALQAMTQPGEVTVSVDCVTAAPPNGKGAGSMNCVRVGIVDQGEGMAPESLQHIFEPFFTTKDVGEGTGLGLSIAYGIVREHGGWIDVESEPGHGSCFAVFLPREVDECDDASS